MTDLILWGLLILSIIESIKLFFDYRQHQKLTEKYKEKCFELMESYKNMEHKYLKILDEYQSAADSLDSRTRIMQTELIETHNQLVSTSKGIVSKMEDLMKLFTITTELGDDPSSQKATQELMNTLNADISEMTEALKPILSEELGYENELQL